MTKKRFTAEWEEQDGVLLAWPHATTDWEPHLPLVEPVFIAIARSIAARERVVIVTQEEERVRCLLAEAGTDMSRIVTVPLPSNDTWARDFGPLAVEREGNVELLDFGFNGWGLKFAACHDNRITQGLADAGVFHPSAMLTVPGLILEGGSVESDGNGTILTTAECLLDRNRNPHLSREELERKLCALLGANRILWLENGYLAGDDTDSHVDTLARLCPDDTIAYVQCDDPADEHFAALAAMERELQSFRTTDGRPYRLIPLPWPKAKFDDDGDRLPATYANYLVINDAVLVPTYRDGRDDEALAAVAEAYPGREIVGIDCLPLILQHGSLHCVTMQLPKGVLK